MGIPRERPDAMCGKFFMMIIRSIQEIDEFGGYSGCPSTLGSTLERFYFRIETLYSRYKRKCGAGSG